MAELKTRIQSAQQRAALAVNRELIELYWQIGRDILDRQAAQGWGAKVIERLAHDLRSAFPEMKGFSRTNLLYMRAFAEAWPDFRIVQQAVGQLPWGHNLVLLTKLKLEHERLAYARLAIENGWNRKRSLETQSEIFRIQNIFTEMTAEHNAEWKTRVARIDHSRCKIDTAVAEIEGEVEEP